MKNRGVFSAIFSNVKPARRNAVAGGLFAFIRKTSLVGVRSFFVVSLLIISSKLNVFAGQALNSWVSMANAAPTGTAAGASTVYAEKAGAPKVYNIRGGATGFGIYDINTDVWISTTVLPFAASNGANMTWDGGNALYILLGGATFYHYDIDAATFTRMADPPGNVAGGGSIVYVSTAAESRWCYAFQGGSTALWRYNIGDNTWQAVTVGGGVTGAGSNLLWTGGEFIYGVRLVAANLFKLYNVNTDSWVSLANMPGNISTGGSLAWNGILTSSAIYVTQGGSSAVFWKYDCQTNQWDTVQSLPATVNTNNGNKLITYGDYLFARRGVTDDSFWRYRHRDIIPPHQISSFAAAPGSIGGQIDLVWMSPGNDAHAGDLPAGSTFYIQYASWTGVNFSTDTRPPTGGYDISIPTGPITPGTSVYYTKSGLTDGVTYYFRIWAQDNAGNYSEISTGATAYAQVTTDFADPDAISSLQALAVTKDNTVSLRWISPGSDGDTGDLLDGSAFIIQYASGATVGAVVWDYSDPQAITISTSALSPGTTVGYDFTLQADDTYYFRAWTKDAAGNYSSISNGATMYLGYYPPSAITDLSAAVWNSTAGAVALQWTAPADPPSGGAVSGYVIRYATWNFTSAEFDLVSRARFTLTPKSPGQTENVTLTGLPSAQTVYFRIKSSDTAGVWSAMDTTDPPASAVVPAHIVITQFAAGTTGSTAEFVELYNPNNYDINLETLGLKIRARSSTGASDADKSITFSSQTIKAYGYFLLGTAGALGEKHIDGTLSASGIANDGSVYITLASVADPSQAIDLVSWGTLTDPLMTGYASPAVVLATGDSLKRTDRFTDTNRHSLDFFKQTASYDPKNSSDPTEPPPAVVPAPPSWVAGDIEITTGSVKWVLKNEHNATVEMFVATGQSVPQRIGGAELGEILTTETTSWTEYDLDPNTAYTRYGEAYLVTGSSWSSGLTKYTLAVPPDAPTAVALSYDKIDVSWASSGASQYIIARSVDDFATPWSTAAVILSPGTTHQDIGLSANTGYKYRIYALNGDDVLNPAPGSASAERITYPAAPTAFSAQNVYITSVTWSWTASAGGADGYRVYMASSPETMAADVAAATTYNEENLGPNAEYGRFAVAYNATGESLGSNETTTYTMAAAPTALVITEVFSSSVTLSWTDGVNPAGTRYGIARDDNSDFAGSTTFYAFSDGLTATTTAATGLGGGATYYFRAWAFNNSEAVSAYSNSTGTVMPPGVPAAPDGLYGLAVSTTVIKWEWNITLNATFYQIFGSDPDTLIANIADDVLAGDATTWLEYGLNSNTNYTRYVRAGNESGLSGPSVAATRYTYAHPPAAVAAAAVSSSTINLSWDNSGATQYQVWVSTVGAGLEPLTNPTTTAALAYAHENLAAGVTHYYRIIPVNGNNLAYAAFNFPVTSTRTWPAPAAGFTASAFTNDSITWQWDAAVGADYYVLYAASDDTPVQTLGDVTSYEETGLGVNAQAGRYIRAHNAYGAGVKSSDATYYTLANDPAALVVTGVTVNSVSLSWGNGGNPGTVRYEVSRSTDNFATNFSTPVVIGDNHLTTTADIGSLTQNTTYWFRVRAFNGDAKGTGFANVVSTKTVAVAVVNLINENFDGGIYVPSGWLSINVTSSTTRSVSAPASVTNFTAANYLFTPLLESPVTLTFQLYVTGSPSTFTVQVGTSQVTTGTWTTVHSTGGIASTWQLQTVDLSSYQNVYVRMNRTAGSNTFNVDDVLVTGYPNLIPPAPISNLTALAGVSEGQLNLRWTSPTADDGASVALSGGYVIKYSSVQIINSADFNAPAFAHGSVTISTNVAVGTSVGYTLSLTPGASYWVAIKSTDSAGNLSAWKSSADVPTINTLAYGWAYDATPAAPANLAAAASDNAVMLTWDAVAAADLSHYELFYSSTDPYDFSDNLIATATVNTTFTHTGLADHVTHYYKVRAVDLPPSVLYGAFSNIVSTFPQPAAPFAPALSYDLSATTTDSIKWVVTDNAANETGLHISSAANDGARLWSSASLASTGGTTSWIETGFGANEAVIRYAEASNAVGSAWSGSLTRYTRARPPSTLAADAVYFSSITLSWSANGNIGSPKYEISISSDKFSVFFATPIALAANHTAVTADISGLAQGTTYHIRARAYNGDNVVSVFSSTMSFITARIPTDYLKIANAGFELGASATDIPGWLRDSSSVTDPSRSTAFKRSGSYAAKFTDPPGTFSPNSVRRRLISSTSTVNAGNNYSVGMWAYVNQELGAVGDTQFRIGMKWLDNAGSELFTSTSAALAVSAFGVWEKLSYSEVAPTGAVAAVMVMDVWENVNNNNDVYIDDVDYRPDTTPPGAVTDLAAAKGTNAGDIDITWTAPGDDGYTENNDTSASYILKYATYPLVAASSATWYNNANTYFQMWTISSQGAPETKTVSMFPGVTYYFLIRTQDAAGNVSEFDVNSLSVQASTCAKEGQKTGVVINEVAPDQTSGQGYDFIEIYNPGPGTPNIMGWEIFDYYTQTGYFEKFEGSWNFPANSYLVIRFSQLRNMTTPTAISGNYYELYSDKTGISQTDNVIVITTGGVNATVIDAVCYADMSGSLTNSTRLRAAYNAAISTNQWSGPLSDDTNDALVETYMASTLYPTSSNWSIARNNYSVDGTNPSYLEWAMTHATTRGMANNTFDITPPAAVGTLAVVAGDNRGTMRVTWTAVGDDGNTGTASGYVLKTRTDLMTGDNFASSVNYEFASKEGQSDTDRWIPKASGQAESYLIGGFDAGATYYIGLKVQDERPNTSALSNVVSTEAANIIGSNVRINELAPLTPGGNATDWMEFYCARGPVNISGWKVLGIIAGGTTEITYKTLPNITLQAGDYLVLNGGSGTDETDASGKGVNGYWDVYAANDLRGSEGVITLKDSFNNIVDFLAYSQGTAPSWSTIWDKAALWKQWAPSAASVADAADWTGGDANMSLGRDSFSTDTDDTAAAKNDWKSYLVPTKGAQNDDVPPAAITNLSALADPDVEGKITLTWTAPGDDGIVGNNSGGYYMVKYATYSVDTSSLAWWNSISTTTASTINKGWKIKSPPSAVGSTETQILTGLYPATTYYFAVRTVDDVANSSALDLQIGAADPAVQARAVATNLPPGAPAGVAVSAGNRTAALSWLASAALDIKEYRISSNTVNNFADAGTTLAAVVSSAALTFDASALLNGVTYYFWIQSTDLSNLTGSTSAVVSAMPIIAPPSALASSHKGDRVELSWTASPHAAAGNFAGYSVYRSSVSVSSGFNLVASLTGGGSTTHYDTSGVVATQTYYYFVRSSDTAGPESFATSVSTAVPDDKGPVITPASPTSQTVTVAVKGSKIIIEAVVADDATTPYISGVNSGTVSMAYSTAAAGVTTNLALDIVENSDSYSGARLLSATFRKELTAATAGVSAQLQSILTNGGTFYFFFYAVDNVANYTVGAVTYTVIIQTEQKTSAAVTASAGGTVALTDGNPDDGETSVTIPAGALPGDITITIEQADPASSGITPSAKESTIETSVNAGRPIAVYIFGPEGTIFAKPVTITLLYFEDGGVIKDNDGVTIAGATEDDLRIYRWDGVEWRFMGGTVDKIKNTVSTKVSHFSVYALFSSKGAPPKPVAMEKFITPNSDGINDRLEFDGAADDFKEITIYDINGRVIRKLEGESSWDARDANGKIVEIGAYIWRAVYANGTANYGTVVVAK